MRGDVCCESPDLPVAGQGVCSVTLFVIAQPQNGQRIKMEPSEKDKLINRLNIVIQQRNSFLDQIVLLQEQLGDLTNKLKDAEPKTEPVVTVEE